MLPERIELSTSPLPRECSTTELRQHRRGWYRRRSGVEIHAGTRRSLPQGRGWRNLCRTIDRRNRPDRSPKDPQKESRAQRLSAALRDNLKRRKAQAKGAVWRAQRRAAAHRPGRAVHRDPRFRRIWRDKRTARPGVVMWRGGRLCRPPSRRLPDRSRAASGAGAWIAFASRAGRSSTARSRSRARRTPTLPADDREPAHR